MTPIKIAVQGQRAALLSTDDLVAGTVGQKCKFFFDDSWQSLTKTIAFRIGNTIVATGTINESNEILLPSKALVNAGFPLEIGLTGYTKDNTLVIPTSWCYIGYVQDSAFGHTSNPNAAIIYDGGVIV